jgi:ribonuclease T2
MARPLVLSLASLTLLPFSIIVHGQQIPTRAESACSNPSLSCPSNLPSPIDTCCLNHPSGHFLLAQFWDAKPALGPSDAWTIHGLWPDLCDGGFDQFCDSSRSYSNISSILKENSQKSDLLDFMDKNWLSLNGNNNHLYSHEWTKHGTCVSTLDSKCYEEGSINFGAVLDYFNHATNLYSSLDSYHALAEYGIIPSNEDTYTLSALEAAIAPSHDNLRVNFRCHGHELNEIWYHFSVRGSLRNAPAFNSSLSLSDTKKVTRQIFIPADPGMSKSNCPASGIRYLPKKNIYPSPTSVPSGTSTAQPSPSSTSRPQTPFSGRGHLVVRVINDGTSADKSLLQYGDTETKDSSKSTRYTGCLIRGGKWYLTSGSSCATYIAKADVKHKQLFSDPKSNRNHKSNHDPKPKPSRNHDAPKSHPIGQSANEDDGDEHLFTLSSLYSPCAILIASTSPNLEELIRQQQLITKEGVEEEGRFTCAKGLGIQTIFSSTSSNSEGSSDDRNILTYLSKSIFYASKVPGKFEKVDLYATAGSEDSEKDDGRGRTSEVRRVEVQIEWQGL